MALPKRWRRFVFQYVTLNGLYQYFAIRDKFSPDRPPNIVDMDVHGFKMRLDTSLFFDYYISKYAYFYDPDETIWVQEHLDPGDVFLDIGSNVGLYSLFASKAVGSSGTVLAIDADPGIIDRLQYNMDANGADNVRILNLGVSDRRETAQFVICKGPMRAASSMLGEARGDRIAIECYPLADVLHEQGITKVRGAKLDIEGMEYRVLNGFLATAEESLWPEWIIVEYFPGKEKEKEAGGNVLQLLEEHGYKKHARHLLNCIFTKK
jgi:FkbM family methyltransferase